MNSGSSNVTPDSLTALMGISATPAKPAGERAAEVARERVEDLVVAPASEPAAEPSIPSTAESASAPAEPPAESVSVPTPPVAPLIASEPVPSPSVAPKTPVAPPIARDKAHKPVADTKGPKAPAAAPQGRPAPASKAGARPAGHGERKGMFVPKNSAVVGVSDEAMESVALMRFINGASREVLGQAIELMAEKGGVHKPAAASIYEEAHAKKGGIRGHEKLTDRLMRESADFRRNFCHVVTELMKRFGSQTTTIVQGKSVPLVDIFKDLDTISDPDISEAAKALSIAAKKVERTPGQGEPASRAYLAAGIAKQSLLHVVMGDMLFGRVRAAIRKRKPYSNLQSLGTEIKKHKNSPALLKAEIAKIAAQSPEIPADVLLVLLPQVNQLNQLLANAGGLQSEPLRVLLYALGILLESGNNIELCCYLEAFLARGGRR